MKKNIKLSGTSKKLQLSDFGLKPVQSADDVIDNVEKYIRINFTMLQRGEMFIALHKTSQEYYDRHDGFEPGGFDYDIFSESYKKSSPFKAWRNIVKKYNKFDTVQFQKRAEQFLDIFFHAYMINDPDIWSEVLERKWNDDILPFFNN